MTFQQIIDAFLRGDISQTEAEELLLKVPPTSQAEMTRDYQTWLDTLRVTPINRNPGPNQGFVLTPKQDTATTTRPLTPSQQTANAGLEGQTDPLTAYLARLGIGSKQNYNPAESYQANLFDPYLNLYQTGQRLGSPGGPLQNSTGQAATFSDFLNKAGTGMGGLVQGAQNQLRSIFNTTGAQKQVLGYEPGQALQGSSGELSGQLDPGYLTELQDLLKYGLRSTAGTLGSRYAAQRLPQAQQTYYGQKATGAPGTENFIDWLRNNWGLNAF